jgi:hypothetical protein
MQVDDALEVLATALRQADVPLWEPPDSQEPVRKLQAAVAPMGMPQELVRFWQLVDVDTLRVAPFPRPCSPEFALTMWEMDRDEFASMNPLACVLVGYESHDCMAVELDVGAVKGGALFEWFLSDPSGFTRRFDTLGDWLAYAAELISHGLFVRQSGERGTWLVVPPYERREEADALRPALGVHPVHGTELHVSPDILEWPAHWQRANGVRPEDLELRGSTHTVAELLATPPGEKVRATVAARVVDLMGSSGFTRVRVDDGTGSMSICCPRETTLFGPGIRRWYEFDVVLAREQRPREADELAGRIDDRVCPLPAGLAARHGGPADATATAVRRMEPPA